MDSLISLITDIGHVLDWLDVDIFEVIHKAFVAIGKWLVLWWLSVKWMSINYGWDVAKGLMTDLHISAYFANMFAHFDSQSMNILLWFRIPEVVNVLLTAYMTRFVLAFFGK